MTVDTHCGAGGINVSLPDGVDSQSLMFSGINITPCDGCKHSGHLQRLKQNASNIQAGADVEYPLEEIQSHTVSVIKKDGVNNVFCTCNCCVRTKKV